MTVSQIIFVIGFGSVSVRTDKGTCLKAFGTHCHDPGAAHSCAELHPLLCQVLLGPFLAAGTRAG